MMKLFLAMTSLCLAASSAAAVENVSSFSTLDNDLIQENNQDFTEKVTQTTDLPEEFNDLTTILPDLPRSLDEHSCSYPGTCSSLSDAKNCQKCQFGFVKDPEDETKCKYANEDENAFLLTTSQDNIRLVSLDVKNTTPVMQYDNYPYSSGIDYNFRTNTLFWFSNTDKTIYASPLLNNVDSKKEIIMHDDSSRILGTAVDWIYNHIYWADVKKEEIVVSNFNGTMKKVLFSDGLPWPSTIVVNPLSGWMYWTDSSAYHIERAGLDGSRREVILSTDIYHPEGLALDLVENRLYWTQGDSLSSIWSVNVDGSHRQMMFKKTEELQLKYVSFRKIALLDKYMYLMDFIPNEIYQVNKCNGEEVEMVHNSTFDLWDLKIYHSSMQPEGENLCLKQIDQCSHFCLPAPSSGKNSLFASTTTCACPDGMYLSSDQQNCVLEMTTSMPV